MPYAAATGRHAARRGAHTLLLAALLGLLVATFTPGFTPPAQASGHCAAIAPADVDDLAPVISVVPAPAVVVPAAGLSASPGHGSGPSEAGPSRSGPSDAGPSGGGPACAVPRAVAVPAADPAGHHEGGGHHGGVRRICVTSACHHRSRFAPLGAPETAAETGALAGDDGALPAAPAVASRAHGLTPSSRTVLRC